MEVSQDNKKLVELVERARSGLLTLPEFQRNFIWWRQSIESLLDSLLRGHYIGSLLFLETDREHMPFGDRPIAGLPSASSNGTHPEDLVLDGQQRITALHYAFSAPDRPLRDTSYPYRFFLDLESVENLEEAEEAVYSERADRGWVKQLEQREIQYEWKTLPFTELLRWEDWNLGYVKWLFEQNQEEGMAFISSQQTLWDTAVRRIRDARVPVVTLPKVKSDDYQRVREICDVFEKLNSTGIRLSVFDLLTARLHPEVKLHDLWASSMQNYPLLRRFAGGEPDIEAAESDDFGVLLLRTVALLRGQEVKSKKLIELGKDNFEEDWNRACAGMEKALERVTSTSEGGFGAFGRRWLPYKTALPVLAALTAKFGEEGVGAEGYSAMQRWYWSSVFLNRYAGSTESLMYQDFNELWKYVRDGESELATFSEARAEILENPGFSLRSVSRQGAAAYKGVMNLVALSGARDFSNNDGITFHDLDDHHIFPQRFLKTKFKLTGGDANTIVNRTLIVDSTNRKISSKSPSAYLQAVIPDKHRSKILASHLIGADARKAMEADDYEAFLAARERALVSLVKEMIS